MRQGKLVMEHRPGRCASREWQDQAEQCTKTGLDWFMHLPHIHCKGVSLDH